MATVKYAMNNGDKHFEVTQSAGSAVTKEIELTVEDSVTKGELDVAIRQLVEHMNRQDAN